MHRAVEQHVHIQELVRARAARPQAMAAPDLRHALDDLADAHLLFLWQARVRQLHRRLDDHAPAGAEDDAGDEDGDDRVEPGPARDLHEHEASEDADRRPDVGAQVEAVGLECLRARLLRHDDQAVRDEEVDDDGEDHNRDAVAQRLRHGRFVELVHGLVDDAERGRHDQDGLDGRREVLVLAVAVVVLHVRRRHRLAHGPEGDECSDEVDARVERLRDQADRADVDADDELEDDERRIRDDGQICCPLLQRSVF